MKDQDLEARLIAARPETTNKPSPFTLRVMDQVKNNATFTQVLRRTDSNLTRRAWLMKQLTIPRKALIFVIVLILSGTGVAAYTLQQGKKTRETLDKVGQNQNMSKKAPKPAPAVTPSKPEKPVDQSANWIKVTSGTSGFTVKIPDGWNVQNWTSRDYLYAATLKDLTYTASKPAVVTIGDTFAIDSGPPRRFNITGNPIAQKAVVAIPPGQPQNFGIVSGIAGKKYIRVYDADVTDIDGKIINKKGDKTYQYRFEGAKTLITVSYHVSAGEPDQVVLVEKAIRTLVFK